MPPWEMCVRTWRTVRNAAWRYGCRWPVPLVAGDVPGETARSIVFETEGADVLVETAARMALGEEPLMGWGWCRVGVPPAWRVDPVTGRTAPGGFGPHLNHRDARRFGEVRRIWELSRHHRWVVLAWAADATGEPAYVATLAREVLDWCRANPYPEGPHWRSGLEVAIRLASWCRVYEACGSALPPAAQAALACGAQHAIEFLLAHRSIGTSANNHELGEAVALIVVADTWPHLERAPRARRLGWQMLARSVSALIGDDGWLAEQSVGYSVFVLDLLLESLRAPSALDAPEARRVREKARALTICLAYLDALGEPPAIGDDDEGKCMPAPDQVSRWDAVLSCAVPALLGGQRPPRTAWGAVATAHRAMPGWTGEAVGVPPLASRAFPAGGVVTLVRGSAAALMDVGPLGFGAIAAHGHADCLQVLLWLDRRPILIDPGMPTYYEEPALRDRYRGTAVHNTVTVGSEDQSTMLGTFLWGRRARVTRRAWELEGAAPWVEAEHDGYRRRESRALHRRRVTLDERTLTVRDWIEAAEPVESSVSWQFHPDCEVVRCESGWRITWPGGRIGMSVMPHDTEAGRCVAEVSPRFGARVAAPRIWIRTTAVSIVTEFNW